MMDESINQIANLAEQKIGFNIDSIGEAFFQKIVFSMMRKLKINSPDVYYHQLLESTEEFKDFVEQLVVPETWFFRDPGSFSFLEYYVTHDLSPSLENKRRLNFLSLASSSGEEPYSMAIQMLEAGLTPQQFSIDAIDINQKAIGKAQSGIFTSYSFRGIDKNDSRLKTYFEPYNNNGLKIKTIVKDCVKFHWGNILDQVRQLHESYYDVIFCKNLLIYMMPAAQQIVLDILDNWLKDKGILVVASVEVEYVKKMGYVPYPYPKSMAFQKVKKISKKKEKIPAPFHKAETNLYIHKNSLTTPKIHEDADLLKKAKLYADSGQFEEAAQLCHNFLHQGPDATAFFILGLIAHASDKESEAQDFFLKTIYLEPDHYEALIYLALISEKNGEGAQAKLFFNRAKRLLKEGVAGGKEI
jgi:chemotaxis protein methyltransferase WspC